MALPPIVAPLLVQVDTAVTGFYLAMASRVAAAATTPFRTLVTVFVVLWGLALWRGLINEPLSDGVARVFRIVLVGTIALGAGVYGPVIASFLYNTPAQLASVVVGGPVAPETVMDAALSKGDDIASGFMSLVSMSSPGASFAAILSALVVWLFTAIVVLYGSALIVLSKVALGILIGFGPLFIALLLFDATKRFFESWLGQALNFLFVFSLVAAAVNIMFALVATAARLRARQQRGRLLRADPDGDRGRRGVCDPDAGARHRVRPGWRRPSRDDGGYWLVGQQAARRSGRCQAAKHPRRARAACVATTRP
jgi:type IV secretion system protein VirB6